MHNQHGLDAGLVCTETVRERLLCLERGSGSAYKADLS